MTEVSGSLEDNMQSGLLMEAARVQQQAAQEVLGRLQEHLRELDRVVRDEVQRTLTEALCGLGAETRAAAESLRRLRRSVGVRAFSWTVAMAVIGGATSVGTARWILPSPVQIAALRHERDRLSAAVARLKHTGGGIDLRRCGARRRLCVRVDRTGPAYGPHGDFLPVLRSAP